jgi:hypothetical protein
MKTLTIGIIMMAAIIAIPAQSQTTKSLTPDQQELIQKNVLANLQHKSLEVRAGTIQLLIDLKSAYPQYDISYALLPLMETLKSSEMPEFRILAALALYHLDSELGRFAVSRRAQFDESPRVARHCATLIRNWDKNTIGTDLIAEINRL